MAKLTNAQRTDIIYVALKGIFDGRKRGCHWETIVKTLDSQLPFKVTNWMEVRSVLQFMINKGEIERTDNVTTEFYVKGICYEPT